MRGLLTCWFMTASAVSAGCLLVCVAAAPVSSGAVHRGGRLSVPILDPDSLPGLPSEGLVIATQHGVLLVDLKGRVLGMLRGFRLAEYGGEQPLAALVQAERGTSYGSPVLYGPHGRAWELTAGRLFRLPTDVIPLRGGAEIVGRTRRTLTVRDDRTGRNLLPPGSATWFLAGRLLVTPKTALDLITRAQWRLPTGVTWDGGTSSSCMPAGISGAKIIAVCAWIGPQFKPGYNAIIRVYSIQQDGRRELLGRPLLYSSFGAEYAYLSPNGDYVAATLGVGCGPSPSIVAATHGGQPRYLDVSDLLGWSAEGEVVAESPQGGHECFPSEPAIYLVDPSTLERHRIYVLPSANDGYSMWSRR